MKRVFSRITAAICAGLVVGCTPPADSSREEGHARVLTPMSDGSAGYSLSVFELIGIQDLQTVSGQFARFFFSPRIVDGKLQGSAPKGRFIRNSDGDYIPADEMTQQLVTVYAHMQRLALLDDEVGAHGVNKWPRDIGVAVKVRGGTVNNAFYDGKTDAMLFVPYSRNELPIAVNGGILAHEHFHSLFYKIILANTTLKINAHDRELFLEATGIQEPRGRIEAEEPEPVSLDEKKLRAYYHKMLLRGMNEGMADFWGWMYTGDPDFIAQSLPSEKDVRSLEKREGVRPSFLPKKSIVLSDFKKDFAKIEKRDSIKNKQNAMDEYVIGYSYFIAPSFSRLLKGFSEIHAQERELEPLAARKEIAKVLLKTLTNVAESLNNLKDEDFYITGDFLNSFIAQLGVLQKRECEFLAKAMIAADENASQTHVCKPDADSEWKIQVEQVTPELEPKK